ncbi:ABC transporter substrate-binding protein [Amycolatopsis suaedae]|uniref:Carbohydrate ABC transporter substrate-binding protein n=1 Tax=Amycolatopsis suaedae TaxID=2510978 RepID=A0A4Q7JA50_9PSEU|nr:ABC transporter substrate-binding protein [Amycolatopsis suaedae]RZQ63836.1 carbohydrate ABC transporter substrate-binding protein [Amycolatopsis suaedae]
MVRRATAAVLAAVFAATTLAGCGGRDDGSGKLVVWSLENLTDRVRVTEELVAEFTRRTGVEVELVAVDENQFSQMIMSAAAAGQLPDVIGALPLTATWQMAGNELLDTRATAEVLGRLDPATFTPRALELTRDGDRPLAVPSDGWAQILVYRKDLFAAAGLPPPDSYERILTAARTLHRGDVAGIAMATAANDAATGQAFEGLAVGNDCQLVDAAGGVTLDSPRCERTFDLVGQLATRFSPPGAQDIDSIRATYFAGRSAMVVWSSFLLDELAGLRSDALPSCPQCQADPLFLARNSGVVGALTGAPGSGEPAQYGELTSWTLPVGDRTAQAQQFVEFMMSEAAYPRWLGMAPEGKIPARTGTPADRELFSRTWDTLPAGVDTKRPLGEIYPPDTMRALRQGPQSFRRWGFEQEQGVLMGATLAEMPVPKAVDAMLGGTSPAEAAAEAADDVRSIQTSLG